MSILVTGGAGFIGSNFVQQFCATSDEKIINLDALTYAGRRENLADLAGNPQHLLVHGNIGDSELVAKLLREYRVRAIVHFAAESHVDRSLVTPENFIDTNIVGTFRMLHTALNYYSELADSERAQFRFLHISTDEVYGTLGPNDAAFSETTPYAPNSPYAASKASADHLVRAYFHSYGLPVITTNCSNNYGPQQFPEKLIPLCIQRALAGENLPIYGDGLQRRDWLYVADHCQALRLVLERGAPGETYNIGGNNECTNLQIVHAICALLDAQSPRADGVSYAQQISFVADRPGHDRRYSVNAEKIATELGWQPQETLQSGLQKTIAWYLQNQAWVRAVTR